MLIAARNAMLAGGGGSSEYWGMYFEAEAANVVVNMAKSGSPSAVTLESSPDGITWTAFDSEGGTTPITLANIGDKVYFRAGTGGNTTFASSTGTYHNFTLSGLAGCYGNIMSLIDGDDPDNVTLTGTYALAMLFRGCRNLTKAPEMPAINLTADCYHGTFWECSSLVLAPYLPAKTLPDSCYDTMFYQCTSLTTLSLAATTLGYNSLSWMNYGCRSLNSVSVAFTQFYGSGYWLSNVASTGTFICPSALGTNATILRGANYCPNDWTVVNVGWEFYFEAEAANVTVGLSSVGTPPAVNLEMSDNAASWTPFTGTVTLANIGDRVYFRAATGGNARFASSESDYRSFTLSGAAGAHGNIMSLLDGTNNTNVAITGTYAFAGLFKNCGNLTSAPDLPATTLSNYCYCGMFEGCTSILTPPALPITTMQTGCYKRMFKGCSALTDVAGLTASAIVQDCCYEMFANCTSIASASVGASSITSNGYAGLFNGCTGLNSLAVGFDSWGSDATYLADWVKGVAASGIFICSTALGTDATIARGDNRCPLGWNVSAPQEYWGMYFEAEAANVSVAMARTNSPNAVNLEYSTNGITWGTFTPNSTSVTLANVGDKVFFRAGTGGNTRIATSTTAYYSFTLSGRAAAGGNIMSLLDADNQSNVTIPNAYAFVGLFAGCSNLTSAPTLPATTMKVHCYYKMFSNCTSLTTAPALPATTLAHGCYEAMFSSCRTLTTAPALPATTMYESCYRNMFSLCYSLTTAPALPATTLAEFCYLSMFDGCTSLTTAPAILPATTLSNQCYTYMFSSCTSLVTGPVISATTLAGWSMQGMFQQSNRISSVEVAFDAWNPSSATNNWVSGVAATGTFKCPAALGDDSTITRGTSNCPSGWTVVNI